MAVSERTSVTFGPVPSRRLGRSLGINNIPAKRCTYGCVYCQLGPTMKLRLQRHVTFGPERVRLDVEAAVEAARRTGEGVDYLTFVPDGEPTLDVDLGREIDLLRPLGIPVAVISNASLIWRPEVRDEVGRVEYLIGYEDTEFTSTGDVVDTLLSISSVHPMRRDQVERMLEKVGADWSVVQPLVEEGEIVEIGYRGHRYYLRKIRHEA